MYSVKSSSEKGTMFRLKNSINRTSVPLDPQDNMKAAEDFLELLLEAHVVTAAECLLSIHSDLTLHQISQMIVDRYVILPSPSHASKCSTSVNDGIHLYACELLSLGLIWYNYLDATRKGMVTEFYVCGNFSFLYSRHQTVQTIVRKLPFFYCNVTSYFPIKNQRK